MCMTPCPTVIQPIRGQDCSDWSSSNQSYNHSLFRRKSALPKYDPPYLKRPMVPQKVNYQNRKHLKTYFDDNHKVFHLINQVLSVKFMIIIYISNTDLNHTLSCQSHVTNWLHSSPKKTAAVAVVTSALNGVLTTTVAKTEDVENKVFLHFGVPICYHC